MKKLVYGLTLLTSLNLSAQNLDNTKLTQTEYHKPPMQNVLNDVKTIFVEGNGYNVNEAKNAIESDINKNIYTIVGDRESADLIISVNLNKGIISPMRTTSNTETKTDKNGKSYTVTTYYATGSQKYNISVKFIKKTGEVVNTENMENTLNITNDKTASSDKPSAETKYYNAISTGENEVIYSISRQTFYKLESNYLIGLETLLHVPLKIKSRKFDYTDINEAADLLLKWIEAKTFDANDTDIIKALGIYEEALKELNEEEKKVRVNSEVGALCYYELAYYYFATKNYSKANEYIIKSESLDKRINYTQEQLKDVCADLQKRKAF
ncbi:MAG: hypothetical protein HYR91_05935 [Flavobacteriia bacterium]|nr:hypothetical protein [Flavobacteriia bacterium]